MCVEPESACKYTTGVGGCPHTWSPPPVWHQQPDPWLHKALWLAAFDHASGPYTRCPPECHHQGAVLPAALVVRPAHICNFPRPCRYLSRGFVWSLGAKWAPQRARLGPGALGAPAPPPPPSSRAHTHPYLVDRRLEPSVCPPRACQTALTVARALAKASGTWAGGGGGQASITKQGCGWAVSPWKCRYG